jgi:hypothetical protein
MPTATVPRAITTDEAADALKEQLGGAYQVTPHGRGSLTVKHGPLAFATVRLGRDGNTTTFRVHGGGLILLRVVNELGIARTVTTAIKEGMGSAPAG